jgi:hypothetical protein
VTPPRVRPIAPDEGEALRAIRLRALADAPLAFGSTHAREAAYPPERWRDWAEASSAGGGSAFFFAVDEASGAPVGLASGTIWEADAETAHLYAMWVSATDLSREDEPSGATPQRRAPRRRALPNTASAAASATAPPRPPGSSPASCRPARPR